MKRCFFLILRLLLQFLVVICVAQTYCLKDEQSFQSVSNFQYSEDSINWKISDECFALNESAFCVHIRLEDGTYLLLLKSELPVGGGIIFTNTNIKSLNEVIVTANRIQEKRRDIPQDIRSIKRHELYRMQTASMSDVLMQSGEVYVQKSQLSGGSPVLRGFEANRVLLVVDGVRMNNLMFRAGHLQNVNSVDPFILENTDILMGPSSVMFGADAMGGVIFMRSRKPNLLKHDSLPSFSGQAFVRGYSANLASQYHSDFEVRKKKWATLSSFTFYQSADLRAGKNRPEKYGNWGKDTFYVVSVNGQDSVFQNKKSWIQKFTGYQQVDLFQKFVYKTGENSKLFACTQYSVSSDAPRYDRLEQVKNGTARYAEWYYGPHKRNLNYVKFESSKKTVWSDRINILGAYQYFRESRHNRILHNSMLQNRIEKVHVSSLNIDIAKKIGKHEFRYGLEGTFQHLRSNAHATNIISGFQEKLDTRYPDGGSEMITSGVYFFDAIELSKSWIIQGAVRYNTSHLYSKFQDSTFFKFPFNNIKQQHSAITGSASIQWLPTKWLKNVVLFSSAYKSPNVDDLTKIFESTQGRIIVPNETIKPERTYTLEYGFEMLNSKKVQWQTRAYFTWYQDVMALSSYTYQGKDSILYDGTMSKVYAMQNRDEAHIYGAYSSLWFQISRIQIVQSATVTMGQILSDTGATYLDHIPPFFGKTSIMYSHKRYTGELMALYNGMKPIKEFSLSGEDNADQTLKSGSPSWVIFTCRNQISIQDNIVLSFAIENITDRYYRPFASGIAGAGRNFIIGVKGMF